MKTSTPFSVLSSIICHYSWAVFFNMTLLLQAILPGKKELQINDHQTAQLFNWCHQITVHSPRLSLKPLPQNLHLASPLVLNHHIMNLTQRESISTQFQRDTLNVAPTCWNVFTIPGLEGSGIRWFEYFWKHRGWGQQSQGLEDSGTSQGREGGASWKSQGWNQRSRSSSLAQETGWLFSGECAKQGLCI